MRKFLRWIRKRKLKIPIKMWAGLMIAAPICIGIILQDKEWFLIYIPEILIFPCIVWNKNRMDVL